MTGARGTGVRTAVRRAELPMLRAYRLWFEHTRKCAECKGVRTAQDCCAGGRDLWAAYRHAYAEGA
ncbi:hypothetical protein [Streptomyces graminilatus]|uniref:hypothetical protein n=1 Tax=Streptomyces graminilatus TaxID=1464070 RepID=UPI0006E2E143|nr:hypothetical protein [Streptomyces graminilatus]